MIKSMTGFAALTREDAAATVSVTIKAVNHRFLDLQMRMPSMLQHLEAGVRAQVQQVVSRGRVEISVNLQMRQTAAFEVQVNESIVTAFNAAIAPFRDDGTVTGALTPGDLLRIPQAIAVREVVRPATDPDSGEEASDSATPADSLVLGAVADALEALDRMRVTEGGMLRADLDARCAALGAIVEQVVTDAKSAQDSLQARLQERVSSIAVEPAADQAALASEIVRFVARSDIDEEIVRFRSHLAHWQTLADSGEPCGRKLDFLLQEMNREINTMGSKAEGTSVPARIVAAKAELERLREQVQNVE